MNINTFIFSLSKGNGYMWFRFFHKWGLNLNWNKNKFKTFSERNNLVRVLNIGNIRIKFLF